MATKKIADKTYVVMQARVYENQGLLHLQGAGEVRNRSYGISDNLPYYNSSTPFREDIFACEGSKKRVLPSMAKTNNLYFSIFLRVLKSGNLEILFVRGNKKNVHKIKKEAGQAVLGAWLAKEQKKVAKK